MPGWLHLKHTCILPNHPLPKFQQQALVQSMFNPFTCIYFSPVNQNVLQQPGWCIAATLLHSTPVVGLLLLSGALGNACS